MTSKDIIVILILVLIFSVIMFRLIKDKKKGSMCSKCNCMDFQIELEKLSKEINK